MMKRMISMLLVLALALSIIPVTAGAVSSGKQILEGPQTYTTDFREYESNNTKEMADWFDAEDAYVSGEVGQVSAGDYYDWYYFTINKDCRLTLFAISGAGGCNTTRFNLYDEAGSLIKTASYFGETNYDPDDTSDDNSDDEFFLEADLPAGKYYIRVTDTTYWVDYHFETFLLRMLDTPKVSVSNRASDGKPVISWDAVEGIETTGHYSILRSTSKNGTYSAIARVEEDGTSYVDTSAKAGTTYYYKVVAEAEIVYVSSFPSSPVSRTCDLPRPTGVKATRSASTGKVTVSWSKVTGADKYSVYYSTDGGSTYSLLKTLTGTSLTHSSATLGKTVYYKVKAVDSDKSAANSAYSSSVTGKATCAAPTVTLSNVASTGKIKISWNAVSGAKSYDVYRSADGSTWSLLKNTTGTSLTNTSAKAGETWYYRVRAVGSTSAANSSYSSAKSRTCDLAAPTLSLTKTSAGKPKLTWTKVTGADKYSVYCSTDGGSTYSLLKTVTSTSLTHSSATAGKTYYYKVKAVESSNSAANSAYSNTVSGKATATALAAPTLSVTKTSAGKPKLSWNAVSGAAEYKVYYSTDNANWSVLKTMTGTSLTHTSAAAGKTYYYKVMAVSGSSSATNSAYSNTVSCKVTTALAAPTLSVTKTSAGKPKLSWNAVSGAAEYKVYYSTNGGTSWSLLKTMTGTSLTHTSATAGKTYYYKVMAVSSSTSSPYSNVKTVTVG